MASKHLQGNPMFCGKNHLVRFKRYIHIAVGNIQKPTYRPSMKSKHLKDNPMLCGNNRLVRFKRYIHIAVEDIQKRLIALVRKINI